MNGTPKSADEVSVGRNRRSDAMFVAAYVAVSSLVYIVVYQKGISEYAQGVITLVLGAFIGFLTSMYNFETGTTRSSQSKDTMMKDMAETATSSTENRLARSEAVVQEIAKAPIAAAAVVAAGGTPIKPD